MRISNSLAMDFSSVGELHDAFSYRIWFLFTFFYAVKKDDEKTLFSVQRLLLLITCGYGSFICKSIRPSKAQIDLCECEFFSVMSSLFHSAIINVTKIRWNSEQRPLFIRCGSQNTKFIGFPILLFRSCLFVKATTFFFTLFVST